MSKCMWLVYDHEGLVRNSDYVRMYEKLCQPYGLEARAVLDTDVKGRIVAGENPEFVLVRTICPEINAFFESKAIPVFNSSQVSKICNDKGKTLEYLRDTIFSVPSLSLSCKELSTILKMQQEEVRAWFLQQFSFSTFATMEQQAICEAEDFVVKAISGHGGKQVFSVEKERDRILDGIGVSDVVLQPMIRSGQESQDMRVYVIGKEIVAAVLRSSREDFRANFSRGGTVQRCFLTDEQREAVKKIIEKFSFGMVGIDFIFDQDGNMIFNEIEDVVGARMLYQCAPEIDIAQKYVDYILKEKLHMA